MINVKQREFAKAATFAGSVLQRRNTIPILSAIKVTANGALVVEGTDLDLFARAELPYDGEAGEFSLTDPGKLVKALKSAGGDTVGFRHDEAAKRLHVESGDLSFDLCAFPTNEHPAMERVVDNLFHTDVGKDFFLALDRVRPAISTEETRYYLNGVYMHKVDDGRYRFAATDGHRLFVMDVPLPDATGELPAAILAREFVNKAIETFRGATEPVAFAVGHSAKPSPGDKFRGVPRGSFSGPVGGMKLELTQKFIDGTYPDYSRVIPTKWESTVRVGRAALVRAIRSLIPLCAERKPAVKLALTDGKLQVEMHSPDIGKSRIALNAEHSALTKLEIGFNAQYLLDVLDALTGREVELRLIDAASPTLIVDPADTAFLAVLVPVRL